MKNFEKNKIELEQIIKSLENGEVTLEDSLNEFKRGIEIYQGLSILLNQAEEEVKIIVDGQEKPFKEESDN